MDFLSLALADEGMKVGTRDDILCLSLDFQVARISFFSPTRSALVALVPPVDQGAGASLNNP